MTSDLCIPRSLFPEVVRRLAPVWKLGPNLTPFVRIEETYTVIRFNHRMRFAVRQRDIPSPDSHSVFCSDLQAFLFALSLIEATK